MKGAMYRFCGCVVSMPVAAWLLPGVHTANAETAWVAGLFLGLIYLILRPLAKLILLPFNCLTFGILGFVIDVLLVQLAAWWMPGFLIDGFLWAVLVAVIVSFLREGAGSLAGREARGDRK